MLDRDEATKKDVILAIGPEASRQCFGAAGTRPPRQAVTLHSVTLAERKTILINCQLPFRCELSHIPDAIELGHHTLHHLKGAYPHAPQVACSLYTELLAPFSSVVILFVSEFGALARVVDFLWAWLRSAMLRPLPFCPEVILAVGRDDLATLREIRLRLVNYGLKSLRVSDPHHAYSHTDVDKMISTHLNLSMMSTSPVAEFSSLLQASLQRARYQQQQLGIDFTVGHWKALVRSALACHAEYPTVPINFYHLSRLRKPVPLSMGTHMSEFVLATSAHDVDQAMIIASALSIDAFPPGMHRKSSRTATSYIYSE
ncbi:patatin-like serine [Colletotrichum asianum]|uniref:Patatin-like serine n=1 Tax=Colletotrichum asianum TaxID=702518 RepID=A0A8H3WNA2_9PEZI|nr:patatin-like serine [Colletotrichum asianum]